MKRSFPVLFVLVVFSFTPLVSRSAINSLNLNLGVGVSSPALSGDLPDQGDFENGMAIEANIGVIYSGRVGLYFNTSVGTGATDDILGDPTSYTQTNIGLIGRFYLPGEFAMYFLEGGACMSMLGLEGDGGTIYSDLVPGGIVGAGFSTYPGRNRSGMDNVRYGLEVVYVFADYGSGEYDPRPGKVRNIDLNTDGGMFLVMFTIGYEMEFPGSGGTEVIKEKKSAPRPQQNPKPENPQEPNPETPAPAPGDTTSPAAPAPAPNGQPNPN